MCATCAGCQGSYLLKTLRVLLGQVQNCPVRIDGMERTGTKVPIRITQYFLYFLLLCYSAFQRTQSLVLRARKAPEQARFCAKADAKVLLFREPPNFFATFFIKKWKNVPFLAQNSARGKNCFLKMCGVFRLIISTLAKNEGGKKWTNRGENCVLP